MEDKEGRGKIRIKYKKIKKGKTTFFYFEILNLD